MASEMAMEVLASTGESTPERYVAEAYRAETGLASSPFGAKYGVHRGDTNIAEESMEGRSGSKR
jgi:hypothetical protein